MWSFYYRTAVPSLNFAYANSAHPNTLSLLITRAHSPYSRPDEVRTGVAWCADELHRSSDLRSEVAAPVFVVPASLPLGFEHELSSPCRTASSARSYRLHPTCTSNCRSPRWRPLREKDVLWARKHLLHIFPHASCWARLRH